jgi:anti-sigma regulatory factor (Ser/Thr protein kinase)
MTATSAIDSERDRSSRDVLAGGQFARRARMHHEQAEPDVAMARWVVATDAERLASVPLELAAFAAAHGMPPRGRDHVVCAVREALANAAAHAYPDGGGGPVVVDAATDGLCLSLCVRDEGTGVIEEQAHVQRGVLRMTALCDRLELSGVPGEGTCVLMEFAVGEPTSMLRLLSPPGPRSASV